MHGMIRTMIADGRSMEELQPIINLAQAIDEDTDEGDDSQDSEYSGDMWKKQVEVNINHKMNELKLPPPRHNSDTIAIEPEPPNKNHTTNAITNEEQRWIDDIIHVATAQINKAVM